MCDPVVTRTVCRAVGSSDRQPPTGEVGTAGLASVRPVADGGHRRFRTWGRRRREAVDRALDRGTWWTVAGLALAAALVALTAAVVIRLLDLRAGGQHLGLGAAFWQSFVRTLDPGQITEDRGGFAFVALVVTLLGLVLVSTLISLVNNQIQLGVERSRTGRQRSRKRDHVVILGWTGITTKILEEFCDVAADGDPLPEVVVMADRPIVDMHLAISEARARRARRGQGRVAPRLARAEDGLGVGSARPSGPGRGGSGPERRRARPRRRRRRRP